MPQIGVSFLLITCSAVCYRMIDWKKHLELLNEKASKNLESVFVLLVQKPCIKFSKCMIDYCR